MVLRRRSCFLRRLGGVLVRGLLGIFLGGIRGFPKLVVAGVFPFLEPTRFEQGDPIPDHEAAMAGIKYPQP